MSITRPALAGLLGVVVCGIGVLGEAAAAQAAGPYPTITGTATCDPSTSHWIVQWSVRTDHQEPLEVTGVGMYRRRSPPSPASRPATVSAPRRSPRPSACPTTATPSPG